MNEMLLQAPAKPRAPNAAAIPATFRILATFSIAVGGILTNKARAGLTLLGIVIGVASVIVAVAIGNGSSAQVASQISSLGANLIEVQPGATSFGGVRGGVGSAGTLTVADAQAMADQAYPGGELPDVAMVAPEYSATAQVVAGDQNTSTSADGVTPEYLQVRSAAVANGRFITTQDVVRETQVVVLGATVHTDLFPTQSDVVGSNVELNGVPYQVIGIMAAKGGQGDNQIFVPLTTAENKISQRAGAATAVSTIDAEAVSQSATTAAQDEIEGLLRSRHKLTSGKADDFSFLNQTSIQQTASSVASTLTTLLTAISAVSLLVGGIGIMNIMLVTVTERTREIGLRKAVGARKWDILAQFLTESILISGIGGGIGVGLSFLVAWVMVNVNGKATGFAASPPLISSNTVVLAFGVSLAIGLFFGSYPASRAAALDPIQALRYE
jgi:putative ABC transport system permease protein